MSSPVPPRLRLAGRPLSVVGRARLYVCGVTPYDVTHLGHAATYVWVDAVDRVLRRLGVAVEVCRNVTDVDDVLFEAAGRAGAHYDRFAAVQQFHFERDMDALGVRRPAHEPRASRYVPQVVELAGALLDAGAAYTAGGSVYLPGAGVVEHAGLTREQALEALADHGGRVDDPAKRDPLDQAVWQRSEPDEPAWPSPWGPGRPGWHAECTAMSLSTYGASLDLHAGGADLRFPHHAYEAAQAEAATGVVPFARSWLHVGLVGVDGEKMAKSRGNLVFVRDLLEQAPAAAVRLLLLDRRYGDDWQWTPDLLEQAGARLDALYSARRAPGQRRPRRGRRRGARPAVRRPRRHRCPRRRRRGGRSRRPRARRAAGALTGAAAGRRYRGAATGRSRCFVAGSVAVLALAALPACAAEPADGTASDLPAPATGRAGSPPVRTPTSTSAPSAGASSSPPPAAGTLALPPDAQAATVVRQVDGDTIVLRGTGPGPLPATPTKVRFLQVDTPEVFGGVQCFGREASARTAALLPDGSPVSVAADRGLLDRYGRTLLLLWDDEGRSVQEVLVAEGYARVLSVAPNQRGRTRLEQLEAEARAAARGRWGACPAGT